MHRKLLSLLLLIILLVAIHCSQTSEYVVHHQVTGLMKTNSYLLYDVKSKQAALFDVGGPIDSLESIIEENDLEVKYIFVTHCHVDHVHGVPGIKARYPQAKIGFSREEFEDTELYARWEELLDPKEVAVMKSNPVLLNLMSFDYETVGEPDVFLEDDQIIRLGNLRIKTYISPGHSRGSVCFHVGNALFSGDVLFYRRVGRTDFPRSGGPEAIQKSVRRLYALLPDETIVYPGHGKFTDIGSEKMENEVVPQEPIDEQN